VTLEEIEQRISQLLGVLNVEVVFGEQAVDDLKGYHKEMNTILSLLVAQARKGPLIKPNGYGEPLIGELFGFTKIKPRAMSLRIVYRPVQLSSGVVRMEIIAIGPKDKEKVYELATRRLVEFREEIDKRFATE
jgi:mRNA interferase RelE/StbE